MIGRRLRRVRDEDDGFALVFVLFVITVITLAVTAQLVVTGNNIRPAKASQDAAQALAAAEAGIQAFVAAASAQAVASGQASATSNDCLPGYSCSVADALPASTTSTACTSTSPGTQIAGAAGSGASGYRLAILNPTSYGSDGFVRVRSAGCAMYNSASANQVLVADVQTLPSPQQFGYYTTYESMSGSYLNQYYPARTIAIPSSTIAATGNYPSATSVTWASRGAGNTTSPDQCDRLYYDSSGVSGRGTVKSASIPLGYDYSESGTVNGSTAVTRYGACEENLTSGMTLSGPVYSRDALYLSYGTNPTTSPTGPQFAVPTTDSLGVQTGWSTSSNPAAPNTLYRSFPYVGGGISAASATKTISTSRYDLELPASVTAAKTANTAVTKCFYSGPTRILLSGTTATITSPYTRAVQGSPCYSSASGMSGTNGLAAAGVLNATVNTASALIYVQNLGSSSSWRTANTSTPVFASSTPATAASSGVDAGAVTATDTCSVTVTYSATGTCAWTNLATVSDGNGGGSNGWTTYTSGTTCSSSLAPTDRLLFECEFNGGSVGTPHDYYSILRSRFQIDLARGTCANQTGTALSSCVSTFMTTELAPANTSAHRYVVTSATTGTGVTGATKSLGAASTGPEASDPFFASTTGSAPTETQTITPVTVSVGRQVSGCYVTLTGKIDKTGLACNPVTGPVLGTTTWGDGTTVGASVPQFQTTVSSSSWAANPGAGGTSTFPVSGDITPYQTGSADNTNAPGDAYIEGTGVAGKVSVVAEHDVVVTGKLLTTATSGTDAKTGEPVYAAGGAADIVGANDVRIYHPVSCKVASTTTTAGFCANDITGLYTGGIASASFATAHPSRQYCSMTSGAAECGNTGTGSGPVSEIDANVFALGVPGADGSPSSAQTRQGSLLTDNYDRGSAMGNVTVKGGVYQLHRGVTGVQWEITTTDTTTTRPSSGYTLQYSYLDLRKAALPWVPAFQSGSNQRAWNVVSISTGTTS